MSFRESCTPEAQFRERMYYAQYPVRFLEPRSPDVLNRSRLPRRSRHAVLRIPKLRKLRKRPRHLRPAVNIGKKSISSPSSGP